MTQSAAQNPAPDPGASVSMQVVRELVHEVERAGVARSRFLRAARLRPAQLDAHSEHTVPCSVFYELCELAVEVTRDPALGLHWGERLEAAAFAPMSHLLSHAPTLRSAFDSLAKFQRLLSGRHAYELLERDGQVTVRCNRFPDETTVARRFVAEMVVTGLFRLVRFFRPHASLDRVSFEHAAPAYRRDYERVFAGAERFDQPFSGLVFDSALLSTPSPCKDEDLHAALHLVAERRMLHLTQHTPYALRVRDVLLQQQGMLRATDMTAAAHAIGLSARTLRRRLSAEGKPYTAILNEARRIRAEQLLSETEGTIQEAAFRSGFSEAAAFHRAFKRWTGMTPSAFRSSLARRQ